MIDKTGYYPKPLLDDDEEEIIIVGRGNEEGAGSDPEPRPDHQSDPLGGLAEEDPDVPKGFVTTVSHFLSWVLVPMLMPVYGIMLIFGLTVLTFNAFGVKLAFTAITFGFNVVIPAVIVLMLKRFGVINDIGLNRREERSIPYAVSILCLIGTAVFFHFKGAPQWVGLFFIGGAVAGIVELIVNRWWKISVHAAGIAGLVAMLLHLMLYEYTLPRTFVWLLISIGCCGLLGAARIWLGRHTLWQVLAGYAVGFCAVFFIM